MLTIVRHFERVAQRYGVRALPFAMPALLGLLYAGCGQTGSITDTIPTVDERDLSAIAGPTDASQLRPGERVPPAQFADVGDAPLGLNDTQFFVHPSVDHSERESPLEGLTLLTRPLPPAAPPAPF